MLFEFCLNRLKEAILGQEVGSKDAKTIQPTQNQPFE
jgi:hypothetical protein